MVSSGSPRRHAVAIIALLLAAVLAGCGTVAEGPDSLPDGGTVDDRLGELRTIAYEMEINGTGGQFGNASGLRVTANLRTGERRAVVTTGPQAGQVVGSNGSSMWIYTPSANRVRVIHTNGSLANRSGTFETIERIFARLNAAERGEATSASISQLPVVPRGAGPVTSGATSVSIYGNVTLTYEGTTTVAGRETYVVHLDPVNDEQAIGNTTFWFDTEWYYPIKAHTVVSIGNRSISVTQVYRNVTFNPDVTEGTFAFDPPANATIVTQSMPETETYESRRTLVAATDASVPAPDVPPGFDIATARRTARDGNESLTLEYTNGSAELTVTKGPDTGEETDVGQPVEIGDRAGRFVEIGSLTYLTWDCGGSSYTVGGDLPRETLFSVARSIDCS